MKILSDCNATLAAIVISLDREEVGQGDISAIQEIKQQYAVPVCNVICLDDLIKYLQQDESNKQHLDAMLSYQQQYGIKK